MDEQQRFLIISNKTKIVGDLIVGDVLSYLQSKFVLDYDEVEEIKYEITSRKRAEKLISILLSKSKNLFNHFHDALLYAEYKHLAVLLEGALSEVNEIDDSDSDTDDLPDIDTMLHEGGVPKLPLVYVKREKDILKLRERLHYLKPSDGWVVLHGMGGTGKTLLATDSLNDERLIYSTFPGGIYWLNIGKVDDARLLMKMQNLYRWLDADNSYQSPRNLEEARDRLRIIFSHEHPRCLLVLDDVWSADVIKYFDVRVRILVITRNSGVTDRVSGKIMKFHITENFNKNDSRLILKQWTDVIDLPQEADAIIKHCKGYPLALNMIGALLKCHPNRWSYYLKQLQNQNISKIKSTYSSLYDAIAVSIEGLPSQQKLYYEMLAVFDEDVPLSTKVLSIYFDMDEIDVEDIMDDLIKRSLISNNSNNQLYEIHDIQLSFLKEKASTEGIIKDLHATLVQRYSSYCNNNFASLPDDNYIYWYLTSHLLNAKMFQEAVSLLQNFIWIERTAVITSTALLIKSYADVVNALGNKLEFKEDIKLLKDLSRLVSMQSHVLPATVKDVNLIQIALSQSTSCAVYNLAKKHALDDLKVNPKKLYYEWINRPKEMVPDLILTIKPHEGGVNCCQFAHTENSQLVVSCGCDKMIKIWESKSGNNIQSFEGHEDNVTCCTFTHDDQYIVSASADRSVKVWSLESGNEVLSLLGHEGDVTYCDVSADNKYIASASIDMTVKIWYRDTGLLYHTITDHTDVVNCCCFSADSALIASASNDLYLKVTDVTTKEVLFTCGGDKDFVSYCLFTLDGKGVIGASQNFIQMYSLSDGLLVWSIPSPCDVLSLAYSRDKKYLVVANCDMTARLLDVEKRVFVQSFTGHSSWINDVSFASDSKSIVTAGADGVCKCWAIHPLLYSNKKLCNVFDVSITDEKNILTAVTTNQPTIKILRNRETISESGILGKRITCCVFSNDANHVAAGLANGNVMLFKSPSLETRWSNNLHTDKINLIDIGESKVISCSDDFNCIIWRLEDGELLHRLSGHENILTNCLLLHHDNTVVTSSFDGNTIIWNSQTGEEKFRLEHDANAVTSFSTSPNEQRIATCTAGKEANIWCFKTGKKEVNIDDHDDVIRCVVFSPNALLVATGSDDGVAKIWRASNGELVCECPSHETWIVDMKFNDQSDILMTVSNNIKWFNTDGNLLQTYRIIGSYLTMVKTTPDFMVCVTIDDLGYLYILKEITS